MNNVTPEATQTVEEANIPQDIWAYVYAAFTFGLVFCVALGGAVSLFMN